MSSNLPRNDLSNKQKKSDLRKTQKKANKKQRRLSVAKKRDTRAQEKLEHLKDGEEKEEILKGGKETKVRPLPASNKDHVTKEEIHRTEFTAGGYSATLLKKGGPSKSKLPQSFQDIHLEKAMKNGEKLNELPTDPEQIHAHAMGLKKKPSSQDKARRCPLANYSE